MTDHLIHDIFSKLSKLEDFNLTEKQLYKYLNKNTFQERLEELEENNDISPYKIFVKEKLNENMNLDKILELWQITKTNKKAYQIYLDKYNKMIE